MIVNLRKYLILGANEDLDKFFNRAQEQGFLEFITLSSKKSVEVSENIVQIIHVLKILKKLPIKKPYVGGGDLDYALEVCGKVLFYDKEVEKQLEEIRLLRVEIARVSPFGDFSREEIEYIEKYGKKKIQFFAMKESKSHKANFGDEVIYVGTEYDLDYFITINPERTTYPDMIEMRIDRPLGELKSQLSEVKESVHRMEHELKEFAGHIDFLGRILTELLNEHHLKRAKQDAAYPLQNVSVFIIEAWVPENRVSSLFALIEGMSIHCEEVLIEEIDKVPTCMENRGTSRIGEDLVKIYDIPAITDKDPSTFVFWAFVLFFAMIVNDAGYGLLYLLVALVCKWKFPNLHGAKKRFLNLFLILSVACIVWGVLAGAYFGVAINPKSFLGEISIVEHLAALKAKGHMQAVAPTLSEISLTNEVVGDYSRDVLLELSLIVGIVHVSISLLRYLRRNWSAIGWVTFLIGGYLYFPTVLNATPLIQIQHGKEIGLQLIYGGIGGAILLALIQKRLKGLGEIPNLVQVFADVLSYLRLYALGLAGSIMADTFNGIGQYIGLVAGIFATIVGHAVNILLGIMAGVIHGLRLNFLEWYHYSFDGNGKLFNPLKKIKLE